SVKTTYARRRSDRPGGTNVIKLVVLKFMDVMFPRAEVFRSQALFFQATVCDYEAFARSLDEDRIRGTIRHTDLPEFQRFLRANSNVPRGGHGRPGSFARMKSLWKTSACARARDGPLGRPEPLRLSD